MRKIGLFFISMLLFGGVSFSEQQLGNPYIDSRIGPATAATTVTIAAAGQGLRNCLTGFTVVSQSTYTVRVLNGATTTYALLLPATAGHAKDYTVQNALCSDPNTLLRIYVDNGTSNINYEGFVVR